MTELNYSDFTGSRPEISKEWTITNVYVNFNKNVPVLKNGSITWKQVLAPSQGYAGQLNSGLQPIFFDETTTDELKNTILENLIKVVADLEAISTYLKRQIIPILIYSNPDHDRYLNSNKNSPITDFHQSGKAATFRIEGFTTDKIRSILNGVYPNRIEMKNREFVYIDSASGKKRF